jgi:SAM-dependent methyltransferase
VTAGHCPVCNGTTSRPRWKVRSEATENGVDASIFRPSTDRYGETVGAVVRCVTCGHASLAETPSEAALAAAYEDAADPVSVEEEDGQRATADRGLSQVEALVGLGRLVDLGCWTGSFVEAAARRGWTASGVEPSTWAVERATARNLDVHLGDLYSLDLEPASYRCVAVCDVIEHLLDVGKAIEIIADLLEPGGALYLTTPDAGSGIAKVMGSRWWSVLPMHVQYFTRSSITRLIESHGLQVRSIRTHPKVFTATYYADRLAGYSPTAARTVNRAMAAVGQDERLIGPDFRDRMQVIAVKPNRS